MTDSIRHIIETPSRIEPARLEVVGEEINNRIAELSTASTNLGARLHPRTAASLADVVRVMNCYYSNLIEGHQTLPRDIERALAGELAEAGKPRNLQVEAVAHIKVQREIDRLHAENALPDPASIEFVCWLHREFYHDAPAAMLQIAHKDRTLVMEPGVFRNLPEHEVQVGRHIPPSSIRVNDFMAYFAQRYNFTPLRQGSRILAMATAHHRFNYIHPFLDGNGRVSRLMSHAMAQMAGIGAHGLWSISRGLARGLKSRDEYKTMMDHADLPRQGDLDGRGNLSQQALETFTAWFLDICLDQVSYMQRLFDIEHLAGRLHLYVQKSASRPGEPLRLEAARILDEVFLRGEMARGAAARVSGLGERLARDVLGALLRDGILGSNTPKGPVFLCFPVHAVEVLFPQLYPVS